MEAFTKIIIEEALINERTNQRRLYSAAVAQNNDSEAQKIWDRIQELNNQIVNIKEESKMTREEKLYSMTGNTLIEVAEKLGLKVTKNDLKKGKAKIIEKILAAEADQAGNEEPVEEVVTEEAPKAARRKRVAKATAEVPTATPEELEEEPKAKVKAETKRANLKLTELTYKGETKSIREWADELEMPWPTLYDRVNRNGWSVEDAIETPLGQRRPK